MDNQIFTARYGLYPQSSESMGMPHQVRLDMSSLSVQPSITHRRCLMKVVRSFVATIFLLAAITGQTTMAQKIIEIGVQDGTLRAGTAGTARFKLSTANIPNLTPLDIYWYSSATGTTPITPPANITYIHSILTSGNSTATFTTNASAAAGTYYFDITDNVGTWAQNRGVLTIGYPTNPTIRISLDESPLVANYSVCGTLLSYIHFDLSAGSTYASDIFSDDFKLSNLPPGIEAGLATRMSDTRVTLIVAGIFTTINPSTRTISGNAVNARNINGTTSNITPSNTFQFPAIARGNGMGVDPPTVSGTPSHNSITVNAANIRSQNPGGQVVEYAIKVAENTTVPTSGWMEGVTTFNNLTPNTNYYVFARTKENANCTTGSAVPSAIIKTAQAPAAVTVAIMTKTGNSFSINAKWTGSGKVYVNGNEIKQQRTPLSIPPGTVTITADGSITFTELDVNGNSLATLDVTRLTSLQKLWCQNNNLTELLIDKSTTLIHLDCERNSLTSLNVRNLTALASLRCQDNPKMTSLFATGCSALTELHCYGNALTMLNLSGCSSLTDLQAQNQSIFVSKQGSNYSNPIYYSPKSGAEDIKINNTRYATGASLPNPTNGNTLNFDTNTGAATIVDNVFSGTITLEGYTAAPTPTIVASGTGFFDIKVGKALSDSVFFTLTNGTYASTITAAHFVVSNLPSGLTSGTAVRKSGTVVAVPITGIPNAVKNYPTLITLPASIAAANVTGATAAITPTGNVIVRPIAKGDGADVSGPPTASSTTQTGITVNAVTIPGSNPGGQTVEYAISENSTLPTSGWQPGTTFSSLSSGTAYYVFARSKDNDHCYAGKAQVSAAISTATATTVTPPAITTTALPDGSAGSAYSTVLAATGSDPITWSLQSGNLPPGLTLAADGLIAGTPATSGTFGFTVRANNSAGSDTKTLSIIISPSVGNENVSANELKVYPNPFTDEVRITGADGFEQANTPITNRRERATTLRIINSFGVVVHTQQITSSNETLHLGSLTAGMYFFQLENDGKVVTLKVVKN